MTLNHLPTRVQLTIGFAALLVLMALLVSVEVSALHDLGALHHQSIDKGVPGAENPFDRRAGSAISSLVAIGLAGLIVGGLAVWSLSRNVTRPLDQAVYIAETVASGDLSQEFRTELRGDFGRLLGALGEMEDTLTDLVTRIKTSTDSIAAASQQIDSGNADFAARVEQQAASLEQTTASMNQLTATVRENAERARAAGARATDASQIAERGGAVVGRVVEQMASISTSSKKIVAIIEVIEGIAFQTNILALNAAVEAARAGAQGRGFAVVANEVQSLAARSAVAAREIKNLITDSVEHVDSGAELVRQAGETMNEVVGAVRETSGLLGDMSSALGEQHRSIEQVNHAVGEMSQVTQQNAGLVQQAAGAAAALAVQAAELQKIVGEFKLDAETPA